MIGAAGCRVRTRQGLAAAAQKGESCTQNWPI